MEPLPEKVSTGASPPLQEEERTDCDDGDDGDRRDDVDGRIVSG